MQAIGNHGLDGAPNGIDCFRRHDNTIGQNDFNIQISDDDEEENIFWDNTSCNTQPVTFKQRDINNDIDGSIVKGQPVYIFLIQ